MYLRQTNKKNIEYVSRDNFNDSTIAGRYPLEAATTATKITMIMMMMMTTMMIIIKYHLII